MIDVKRPIVYVVSDSVGETAESVVKAASSQFSVEGLRIRRIPYVTDPKTVIQTVQQAKQDKALIAFTLVVPGLHRLLVEEAARMEVPCVDIMGPMIQGLSFLFQYTPRFEPGIIHQMNEDYFKKVEAIEFAVRYDDAKDPRGILRADVVLIGVSRTSKTPLSMYLAHKRLKVANVPLVPEVQPPKELFEIPLERCVGLMISPVQLNYIRRERLRSLGLDDDSGYANIVRILEELDYAEKVMQKLGCLRIDVSNKAVEETANMILDLLQQDTE